MIKKGPVRRQTAAVFRAARLNFIRLSVLAGLFIMLGAADLAAQVKPADDLIIKGPRGAEFVFRPVPLRLGEELRIAGVEYTMGDPGLGFKAFPTKVSVGGGFLAPSAGDRSKKEWVYYLGKYELTEGQYYAVMDPEGAGAAKLASRLPMTGLTYYEVQVFLDRLNQWLFENAAGQLPALNETPGFMRLPTEAEWEFAARGGLAVPPDVFASPLPYAEGLEAHEWFAGPKSSHNKVQPVGKLKPNPLGLHDMLGNVSEMTNSLYQLEYYQGRSGGLTARGGHYLTAEKDVNVALRVEEPFYIGDRKRGMKPNKKPILGLRLALGSPVMTDRGEIASLEDAWEDYRDSARRAVSPAGLSTAPIGLRTDVKADDARGHLANVKTRLEAGGLPAEFIDPVNLDLGRLEAALSDIELIRRRGESDSAGSWVRIGAQMAQSYADSKAREELGYEALEIVRNLLKAVPRDRPERAADLKAKAADIQSKIADNKTNMDEYLTLYFESLTQIGNHAPDIVREALDKHQASLKVRPAVTNRAHAGMEMLSEHYEKLKKDRAINRGVLMMDLDELAKITN